MKENYRAWAIDVNDFPKEGSIEEQIKFLLGFAVLAPSGHNSQPWNFSIKENSLSLLVNQERSLSQSDPERRQLLIAFGCALENLLIASDYYGFRAEVQCIPDQSNRDLIARILFTKNNDTQNDSSHIVFSIPRRNNNRNKFKNIQPHQDFLDSLISLSDEKVKISIVIDQNEKNSLADIVNIAQIESMDRDNFREELSHFIRSNFTKEKAGMPGFVLGLPGPVSIFASKLIKKINFSRKTKKQDDDLLKKYTPVFVVISTSDDEPLSRIKAGQVFERIWLMAENSGLKCSPLAAGCQTTEYYKEMQKVLKISFRPEVFFRLGYCDKINHHSPRFLGENLLIR